MDDIPGVLIVDDDATLPKTLADILKVKGYAPLTVSTGGEALRNVESGRPLVAVLDLRLLALDGLELVQGIKERSPRTECIVLTGYASESSAIQAINLGAYSYIRKPYDVEQLLVIIRRAAEKQAAELALRESEERYRELMDNANDIIYTHDLEGNFTSSNPAASRLYGYTAEEILHLNIAEIVDPEYLPVAQRKIREELGNSEQTTPYELLTHTKDSKPVWVEVNTRLLRRGGRPVGVQGIARDITERKRAEQAVQRLMDFNESIIQNMAEAIVVTDSQGEIAFANPACAVLLGCTVEELVGLPWTRIVPQDLHGNVEAADERRARGETDHYELELMRQDGERVPVLVSGGPRFQAGEYAGTLAVFTDITELKRAEEALRRRVAALVLLSDASRQIAAVLELDSLLDGAARLIQESFGYYQVGLFTMDRERGELVLGASAGDFTHLFPPDYRIAVGQGMIGWAGGHGETLLANDVEAEPRYAALFPGKISTRSELSLPIRVAEETVGVLDVQSPQPDAFDEGDLLVLQTLADQIAMAIENARLYQAARRELDDRRRAEQALQKSTGQLESQKRLITSIVESIPSSLVVIDHGLRIVSVNRNFLEKARREAPTTIGRRLDEVFAPVLMDHTHLEQKVREVFRNNQPLEGGKVAYRAPGVPTRIYYYRLIPLTAVEGADASANNVMLLMDDITEREQLGAEIHRAEQHLASVVDCANDLVVSLDPTGRIVTWNQAAERVSGLGAEQVRGQSLLSLCADEHGPVMTAMLQRLARGESVQNTEVDLLPASGQQVPIAWSCSSMQDEVGNVTGIVAVGRDLTERRQLEARLIHSAKMASLGVMAGGIAHEVRNPLGIISAAAQLLLESPGDAQLRSECAEKIHAATQRASLIIESLMKFARPQKEQMGEVDLGTTLVDTLKLMSNQLTVQKVTLIREIEQDVPKVSGHPALLQQVFSNMILNACNAMPQGGTLTVACRPTETGTVEVRFSDTGRGIPLDHQSEIFDPFFTTMPVGKGTGLGLSISYGIIREHGGSIEVDSQEGQGASFTIRLPVATSGSPAADVVFSG